MLGHLLARYPLGNVPIKIISFSDWAVEGVPVVVEDDDRRYGMRNGGGNPELAVRWQERCKDADAMRRLLLVYLAKLKRNNLGARLGDPIEDVRSGGLPPLLLPLHIP